MSTAPSPPTAEKRPVPPPAIRWRSWPLREDWTKAAMVLAGIAGTSVLVHSMGVAPHMTFLAMTALAVALWRFFIPVAFELSADGVDQHILGRRRRLPWQAIRRYEKSTTGVLLLPHADRCPMDVFRGLYLPWADRRDEVLAQVEFYLGPPPE